MKGRVLKVVILGRVWWRTVQFRFGLGRVGLEMEGLGRVGFWEG